MRELVKQLMGEADDSDKRQWKRETGTGRERQRRKQQREWASVRDRWRETVMENDGDGEAEG